MNSDSKNLWKLLMTASVVIEEAQRGQTAIVDHVLKEAEKRGIVKKEGKKEKSPYFVSRPGL